MGKKIIIVAKKMQLIKLYEEDIQKVFYLKQKILPNIPSFKFKLRGIHSDLKADQ